MIHISRLFMVIYDSKPILRQKSVATGLAVVLYQV